MAEKKILPVRLIVGLGNIGSTYEKTRHNVGFWAADELVWKYGGSFSSSKKLLGEVTSSRVDGEEIIVLKPSTLMNLSGHSVSAAINYYKIKPEEVLVIHDELDLPAGNIKYKFGGGSAGHNGLKSIVAQIGTPNFQRLRIGIDHPRNKHLSTQVADYVLSRPDGEDKAKIDDCIDGILSCLPEIIKGSGELAVKKLENVKK